MKKMAVIEELICSMADGSISFGNYRLSAKAKLDNFEHNGDLYKVKTYKEITKLERNGMFVYESVPGTTVLNLKASENAMSFQVEGTEDAQITLELEDETEYRVFVDDVNVGHMKTNLGGKLNLSVELTEGTPVAVKIEKVG
jgi:hemolysin activation/secretion protein